MLKFEIYKRTLYEDNNILNILNIENDTSFKKQKINTMHFNQSKKKKKYCIYFKTRYFKTTNLHACFL